MTRWIEAFETSCVDLDDGQRGVMLKRKIKETQHDTRHHPLNRSNPPIDRRHSELAVQQAMGLFPKRRPRHHIGHRYRAGPHGSDLRHLANAVGAQEDLGKPGLGGIGLS